MNGDEKVRQELIFYFWIGVSLYSISNILNIVYYYDRHPTDVLGYVGFVAYWALNLYIIKSIKGMHNWARNLFIVKFALFSVVFYPQSFLLKGGSWMYSEHFPHAVFQRISNFGNFAYEIFFLLFLIKRSVRFVFTHT